MRENIEAMGIDFKYKENLGKSGMCQMQNDKASHGPRGDSQLIYG